MKKLLKRTLLAIMAFGFVGYGSSGRYVVRFNSEPRDVAEIICDSGKVDSMAFKKSVIGSDGLLDIGDCKAKFNNGYVHQFPKYIQTKDCPNRIVLIAKIQQQ